MPIEIADNDRMFSLMVDYLMDLFASSRSDLFRFHFAWRLQIEREKVITSKCGASCQKSGGLYIDSES